MVSAGSPAMPITRPRRADVHLFDGPAAFRDWLEENHATADAAWVGYYRKGVPATSITYREAVDEALCFGWIDGIGYRIDDEVFANRFTRRRPGSHWSDANVARVSELRAAGRMRSPGLRAFEARIAR